MIRATGFADVLPVREPRALDLTARLYRQPAPLSQERFAQLAQAWQPFRTWAVVLIRAVAGRVLDDEPTPNRRRAAA